MVAWESSQNLGTPPLVSPQNDVWKWLQKFHTGNVLCHHPDLSSTSDCNFPSANDQSEALPDLGIGTSTVWNFCSHFSDVISQGNQWWCWKMSAVFSGYLTVVQFSWCKVWMQLGVAMWVGTGFDEDPSSCSFPKARLYGETLSWVEETFPYKMWWTVYVKNKKLAPLEGWPAQPGGRVTALLHHHDFVHS